MAITVSENKREFPKHPEGVFQAVCCDVVDLGIEKVVFDGKEKMQPKIRLYFQTEEFEPDGQKKFIVAKRFTASLSEKSALRQFLTAWRGRAFTKDELTSFDLETLVGANCQLQVVHQLGRDGEIYANIGAVLPIRNVPAIHVEGYVRKRDRDEKKPEEEKQND
jgi:hypothetical protein